MTNNKWTVISAIILIFSFLIGCGSQNNNTNSEKQQPADAVNEATTNTAANKNTAGATTEKPKEEVTLRYMIWNKTHAPTYQKMIDAFTAQNPHIKVDLQVIPWANFWDKLMTEIAGGTAPDVFWGYLPRVPSFIDKNALLDLTPYIERDGVDLTKYSSSTVAAYQQGGKTYSVPEKWDSLAIYYNQDLLKKAGYDSFPENLTWNPTDGGTFVEFLQKMTLDKNGKHPNEEGFDSKNIVQYGFNFIDKDQVDPGQLIGFAASNGATMLKDNKLANDEKLLETYQFLYDLSFKYYVAPTYTDIRTGGSESKFISQQVAVWMNGQWMMKPIKEKASFAWGITKIPEGPAGRHVLVSGMGDVAYAQTKYPEEAWQFIKFLSGKEGQDILASTGAYWPGYTESIPTFVDHYAQQDIDATPFVEQFNGDTVSSPVAYNYDEWYQVFVKYTSLMLSGELGPKETLDLLQKEGDVAAVKK